MSQLEKDFAKVIVALLAIVLFIVGMVFIFFSNDCLDIFTKPITEINAICVMFTKGR